ncbi:MAG: flavin-dependent oxidoreductase [Pararhodobacter sp.]|nr:flavin-dependent oxidoreductase [Pararhodobacter sp.]
MTVLIAGGGIAGLTLALTCHQIGVPFRVFEAVSRLKPMGVGINLQPTAVRELFDLGLANDLDGIGVRTRDYGMYTKKGLHIWTEPRGLWAGYSWPQYSVHRGELHMMLHRILQARAGSECLETGWTATGFDNAGEEAVLHLRNADGTTRSERGALLIGADGIHSAIRRQIAPGEGEPVWGGSVLWRGTTWASPFKTGASMVMIGHDGFRFVCYPISAPDKRTGKVLLNWIANLNYDPDAAWNKEDWNRKAKLDDFLPRFRSMKFDWLDVPALIEGAAEVFEYPMVDRDPLTAWRDGRVSLMGDAAHAAYPVGSNGAGSAIIDARELGAVLLAHGLTPAALQAYEERMLPATTQVVLRNRVAGPDKILDIVEERCGGRFTHIDDVISQQELAEFAAGYKGVAGYGVDATNARPHTIAPGRRLAQPCARA